MIDNSTQLLTSNLNSNILYSVQASSNTYTLLSLFNTSNTYYSNQLLLKQNNLTASTILLGVGSAITDLDYNKITLNKPTNFQADWNTTIINKPSIYTQSETNTLLNAKEAVLTFNAPLTRSTNTIGINLNSYCPFSALLQSNYANYSALNSCNYITNATSGLTNYPSYTTLNSCNYANYSALNSCNYTNYSALNSCNYTNYGALNSCNYTNYSALNSCNYITNATTGLTNYYTKTSTDTLLNAKQANLTFSSPLVNTTNTITFNESSITTLTNFYNKTSTDTLLNTKEAVLTFSSPLTRTTNTIGINLSSYSTTGNDASYLLKTGGTLTGDFNIEKASPIVSIKSSAESQSSIFYLSTPLNITSGLKTAIIAEGLSAWGRSKLHFCLNDNQTDNSTAQNASVSHARMTILPTGNVGIANVSPVLALDIGSTNANHNIGRAILTTDALGIHAPDKRDFLSIGRWDGSTTTDWQFNGIKYGVITGAQAGEGANNHSCITFHTWGNNILNSREVARITSRGRLGLNTTLPTELLDVNGNIKSSGNLLITGNVGIGTLTMSSKVHIEHASTSFNGMNGGFYLYNPNNTTNSSSCLGARIGGSSANKAGVSLDVAGGYGWSMYINGNDTTDKWLRFNSSWDGSGSERLQIRGSDGYTNINGGCYIADYTTIRNIVNDRGSYNHATAPLTITNQTTSGTTLNDSLPVLNICRQGLGGVAYGQRATLCLSRFANDNVWSRTRLDFKLASDSYNDVFAMTLRSDGNTYFYPNPQNINNTNGANYAVNLNVACFTTGLASAPFISCIVNDGWNGIDTSTIITAQSGANSGYNNSSRMILDGSYNTNASFGTLASYISWQSINSSGGWNTNAYLRTTNTSITFRVDGNISCFSLTQTSTSNIKTDIQPIQNSLDIITQLEGHYYKNIKTDNYDYGLIAEEVENILPDIVDKTNEDLIGIKYTSLIPILIESIKELNNKVNNLQKENEELKNRISILEQIN